MYIWRWLARLQRGRIARQDPFSVVDLASFIRRG
jgi:hypothetical protein